MDTSKEYIKMCDCLEIQGQWRHRHDNVISTIDGVLSDLRNRSLKEKYTWLPRQDQSQRLVENFLAETKGWKGVWTLEQSFHNWFLEIAKIEIDTTMEQLWLAFYMWEKHKLTWSGKKWVNKST